MRRPKTRAVGRYQVGGVESCDRLDGGSNAAQHGATAEMKPTDESMDLVNAGEAGHVAEDVDHPGVPATGHHDQPLPSEVQHERLIIEDQRIRLPGGAAQRFMTGETLLEARRPIYLTGDQHRPAQEKRRLGALDDVETGTFQGPAAGGRHFARVAPFDDHPPPVPELGMEVDGQVGPAKRLNQPMHAGGVIVVPVTEDDGLDGGRIDFETSHVLDHPVWADPGIEKDPMGSLTRGYVNESREAMLGHQRDRSTTSHHGVCFQSPSPPPGPPGRTRAGGGRVCHVVDQAGYANRVDRIEGDRLHDPTLGDRHEGTIDLTGPPEPSTEHQSGKVDAMQHPHLEFQPWSARRLEDRRLVTGAGRYVGDIAPTDAVNAAFVRSPVAHGEITELDVEEARQSPGVLAVFTAADLNLKGISSEKPPVPVRGMSRPPLAHERVRFVGETVAVVIAETAEQAVDAAGLAWVDVEPLPVVVDPLDALNDETVLHAEAGTNLVADWSLGSSPASWDFAVDVTVAVRNQRLAPGPIEPLAALAVPDQAGGLRLFVGHQSPHTLKRQLIKQLENEAIEVIVPDVGGGFGMKARLYPEYIVISAAALRLGRPVRWIQTRRENLLTGSHGRDMLHRVRLAGDVSGKIQRAHIDILTGVGAYPQTGGQVITFTALVSQEMYDIEEFTMKTTTVVNNLAPIAPYRGAGRPEAAYAMERAIDVFARRAGIDPVEVRRRNLIAPSRLPYRAATGALYDSGNYPAALERAVDLIDLESVRKEQASRIERGDNPIGVGFGAYVERAGGAADSGEYGRVELAEDGTVVVRTGSTSNGQGHETVFSQVAAEVFDVPLDRVRFIAGDTSLVADGWGSTASRSAQIGASGIWRNALNVRDRATELAAEMMDTDPDGLTLTEGTFRIADGAEHGVTLSDVARHAIERGESLAAEEFYSPGAQTFPYGVYAAVVEVDLETGEVRPIRVAAVDDCGNVLNPMIVDGQTLGSLVQGLGQALNEGVVYDSEGQLLTATLMDYSIPRALDVPETILDRIVNPAPSNPLGVKGAGEAGCIGGPPAFVNAVLDALAPYGVTDLDMPLRAPAIWEAMRKAREVTRA